MPRADPREKSGRSVFLAVSMAGGDGSRGKIDSERERADPSLVWGNAIGNGREMGSEMNSEMKWKRIREGGRKR